MKLPNHFKMKNGVQKYILKKVLEKRLPREVLYRKKKGFGVPVSQWMMEFPQEISQNYIDGINFEEVKKMWFNHRDSKKDNRLFLWNWYVLQNSVSNNFINQSQ